MLERLKKTNLFLNIDKCDFFVIEIKYLRLIIITKQIKMNLIKINVIINWKTFRNLKDVQTFFDFANFYRKFILNYFKLIAFFIKFIKTLKKDFVFSWDLDDSKKKTFQILKIAFITISILIHFDLDKKIWIESDASNYVIVAMMSQMIDEILRFVIFMFKKMSLVECNYEIYDKKLLVIIKVFEKWRSKCARTFVKDSMKILTNYKNLKHFMTSKQLNRKQARWTKFLSKFNFRIIYRFEMQSIKLDNLTRRFENLSKNVKNERTQFNHQILLKIKNLDLEMRKVIEMTLDLMNEREKNVIKIITMMYDLIEKNVLANEKSIEKSFASNFETSTNEKSIEELFVEKLIDQSNIM